MQHEYALGHSQRELDRLTKQARANEAFTRQLFAEAGIAPGMRVLDVGSGSGDVSLLASEMVGPEGEVVGVDRSADAAVRARQRARLHEAWNVSFEVGDPAEMTFDQPFDAVVGRMVLMYCPDRVATLRGLARHLRPGGLIIFQELNEEHIESLPKAPTFELAAGWVKRALKVSGARLQTGPELYPLFLEAGLPAPKMRLDSLIAGGDGGEICDLMAEAVKSLLPALEKAKVTTREEVQPETLAARLRREVAERKSVVTYLAMIGAWARKA
jgi:ubiquinone/menaquinone biosynthesis C-methylase UbiE